MHGCAPQRTYVGKTGGDRACAYFGGRSLRFCGGTKGDRATGAFVDLDSLWLRGSTRSPSGSGQASHSRRTSGRRLAGSSGDFSGCTRTFTAITLTTSARWGSRVSTLTIGERDRSSFCVIALPTAHLNTSYRHFFLFVNEVSMQRGRDMWTLAGLTGVMAVRSSGQAGVSPVGRAERGDSGGGQGSVGGRGLELVMLCRRDCTVGDTRVRSELDTIETYNLQVFEVCRPAAAVAWQRMTSRVCVTTRRGRARGILRRSMDAPSARHINCVDIRRRRDASSLTTTPTNCRCKTAEGRNGQRTGRWICPASQGIRERWSRV